MLFTLKGKDESFDVDISENCIDIISEHADDITGAGSITLSNAKL
ncbi:hypothetical protein fHeYen901_98 [Yersinia phage fHe-Yen9-01]|uniref:Uncharacterized protein n=1 Tax=Yersinia phage fHe-Yen9-01 TaxID=1965363 RepID=A0A1V0DXJ4_9CAUD|nr:hypothetical protein KNT60_gp097 [Yersinia phage fHe-Yen9-01]ARB05871.1 hypothetical protein fHeYen901_98 [Yersinia phage fHe-Yen9-01]